MRSIPILIIALMIAVFVPHVCAENVTSYQIDPTSSNINQKIEYSQEYYNLGNAVDSWMYKKAELEAGYSYSDVYFQFAQLRESRRQTILMEKQNELINEQTELLKKLLNQTYTTECVSGTCSHYNIVPGYYIKQNL